MPMVRRFRHLIIVGFYQTKQMCLLLPILIMIYFRGYMNMNIQGIV